MPKEQPVLQGALDRGFIRVGRSHIEGRGVFARRKIHPGARIIEYTGKRRPATKSALPAAEPRTGKVYSFRLSKTRWIDATVDGNDARFINHSCEPNCAAYIFERRVYIYARREIRRGEELTIDYKLRHPISARSQPFDPTDYPCHCGSANCRGTLLDRRSIPARRKTR